MSSQANDVGQKLVNLCSQGKNMEAVEQLYRPDVVSTEAADMPNMPRTVRGIAKVKEKGEWWMQNNELHSEVVRGPYAHGDDKFAVIFSFDVTPKGGPKAGKRTKMDEVAVYTVRDGKIAAEEFYYPTA